MRYVFKKKSYLILAYFVDAIGAVLFAVAKIFEKYLPQKFNKILLIRLDHIGDIVSATVAIDPLRKKFPGAVIDFLAPSLAADMLEGNPAIDNVVRFDPPWFDRENTGLMSGLKGLIYLYRLIKQGGYDLVIDLRGDVRHIVVLFIAGVRNRISYGITGGGFLLTCLVPYEGSLHETERNLALLKPLGIEGASSEVILTFSDNTGREAEQVKEIEGISVPYVIVHMFPGHSTKNWSISGFAGVIKYLSERKGMTPVIVGAVSDKEHVKENISGINVKVIDISGKVSLGVLGVILKGAEMFIGVDSGPSHIAAAVGTPSVILFSGVNDPCQWAPRGKNIKIICPGEGKDLSSLSVDEVCAGIDEVLGSNDGR